MKNYLTETDLKGFIPELTKYLWAGETDFSKQKEKAEIIVKNDFINRGYRNAFLRVALKLRESGTELGETTTGDAVQDKLTRLRYVYKITSYTAPEKDDAAITITLQGCNTSDGTFEDITTITVTATTATEQTGIISNAFKYYKVKTTIVTGKVDFYFNLVETNYDLFFAYKWLELIMLDAMSETTDQYAERLEYFQKAYDKLWSSGLIFYDADESGTLDEDEGKTYNSNILLSR